MDQLKKRHLVEEKVVEMIINLRYYYDHWQRAKMFAMNLQFVHLMEIEDKSKDLTNGAASDTESEDAGSGPDKYGDTKAERKPTDLPLGFTGDKDVPDHDLYVQEFFLHCFAIIMQNKENFIENQKGNTYIKLSDHDRFTKMLIGTIRGPSGNLQKWKGKMKALVTRIPIEGVDTDFLDLD